MVGADASVIVERKRKENRVHFLSDNNVGDALGVVGEERKAGEFRFVHSVGVESLLQ